MPTDLGRQAIDLLRLSRKDRATLLNDLREITGTSLKEEGRQGQRYQFEHIDGIDVSVLESGREVTKYRMMPRNISDQGICLLHGGFIYENTDVLIKLPTSDGEFMHVHSQILRCRHVTGRVHELGVKFRTPIDIGLFVDSDHVANSELISQPPNARATNTLVPSESIHIKPCQSEMMTSEQDWAREQESFDGRILLVEDVEIQSKVFNAIANRVGLQLNAFETGKEGIKAFSNQTYDLVFVDLRLDGEDGINVIKAMRQLNDQVPIIAISADRGEQLIESSYQAGATHFAPKPMSHARLIELCACYLLGKPMAGTGEIRSQLWEDQSLRPTILAVTEWLQFEVNHLEMLVTNFEANLESADSLNLRCRELSSVCGAAGFPQLALAADVVKRVIQTHQNSQHVSSHDVSSAVEHLIELCNSAIRFTKPSQAA